MRDLTELLIRDWIIPPDFTSRVVYHYTSASGLIGILQSGTLRGTAAAFLNDLSEVEYGRSVCRKVLNEELAAKNGPERVLLERVLGLTDDEGVPQDVYITSFSARRDVLSQWRGYGSPDGRFCIGFQVAQFSERDILQLPRPVLYDEARQRELVRRAVATTCDALRGLSGGAGHEWHYASVLASHLRRLSCSFKHAGFEEEQEWRSVTATFAPEDIRMLQFDILRGSPRPFLTMLAGSRTSSRLPVVEVCVGPNERKAAAAHATRLLLSRYGYDNVRVTHTDIPFAP